MSHLSNPLDLSGRRVFITGGTGIVGRCLLDYVSEIFKFHGTGPEITVLSRNPPLFLQKYPQYRDLAWLTLIESDLGRLSDLESSHYTDIIHAAADTHSQNDPIQWVSQHVDGTKYVLDFARRGKVDRLLFISSGAVYGTQSEDTGALSEDQTIAPLTTDIKATYGNSKRMAEHLCSLYSAHFKKPECVIARCFAIVSHHIPKDGPYALGNFIRDVLAGKEIKITGDGRTVRTYIDGRDMAHWMFSILKNGRPGEAYNVGSDMPVTMAELANAISEAFGATRKVEILDAENSVARTVYVPNISKAKELGLHIETPLALALKYIVDNNLEQIKQLFPTRI